MRLRWALLLPALLLPSAALAQSSPGWTEHQAVHAPEWNALWASKADVGSPPVGGPYLPITGGTLVGPLTMTGPTITSGTWTNATLVSPTLTGVISSLTLTDALTVSGTVTLTANTSIAGASNTLGFFGATPAAKSTGWTAMTGTPDKATAYATGSVTLAQLAGRVAQLQATLTALGLINP